MIVVAGEGEQEWVVVGQHVDKGSKRVAGDDAEGDGKRQRGEGTSVVTVTVQDSSSWISVRHKSAGDVFLANGVRDLLLAELDTAVAASLPFPLIDEEIYEPPEDDDPPESLEQVTERVVSSLPRTQAIEALHGYESMKWVLRLSVLTIQRETQSHACRPCAVGRERQPRGH